MHSKKLRKCLEMQWRKLELIAAKGLMEQLVLADKEIQKIVRDAKQFETVGANSTTLLQLHPQAQAIPWTKAVLMIP